MPTRNVQPEGIPRKPEPDVFKRPVAWLLGRQLIASLKYILLYAAFKGKLDPRDWMKAEVIPAANSVAEVEQFWKSQPRNAASDEEFWFDYVSDTGDGQKAMYSVAFLCMSDFSVKAPQPGQAVSFLKDPAIVPSGNEMLLPRGTFLLIGGDTSYHISDYGTLAIRVQNPFWWAFSDLNGRVSVSDRPRPLFGIPGNHDYYDSLDGFNRQFRRPSTPDEIIPGKRPPLLMLPTFERQQEASYVALRLPFDWWFWGLDTEDGEIDFRQLEFFKDIQKQYSPKKLLVATPEPSIVFGKFAAANSNQSITFKELGLERPFIKNGEQLPKDKCRVDLAGDVHHYARHFGPTRTESSSNYTSVMAGGGGAFFHPSQTNVREVEQQVLYPSAQDSRNETAKQLFKIKNIFRGGYVWLFGLIMAFLLSFSAYIPESSKEVVDNFRPFVRLGISPPVEKQAPKKLPANVESVNQTFEPTAPDKSLRRLLSISIVVAVVMLAGALIYSTRLFRKEYDPTGEKERKKVTLAQRTTVWILAFLAFAILAFGIGGLHAFELLLSPYSRSLIIFGSLMWAILAIILSVLYSGWLFEESYVENVKTWHYWPIWVLIFLSVAEFGTSVWFFGKHQSAYLISDLVQLSILVGMGGGLIFFAVGVGGRLQKGAGKLGFGLLGISHAVLQLLLPFLLIRKGHFIFAPIVAFVIVGVFQFIGTALAKLKSGWPLAVGWVALGVLLLGTPFVIRAVPLPQNRWFILVLCGWAGVIGAIMSCALFGWYLAVSLAFNGHNNEAGGAARIEGFKHFIRFRLNREGLTGYVIAIDNAGTNESELKPKLVDVFHICSY